VRDKALSGRACFQAVRAKPRPLDKLYLVKWEGYIVSARFRREGEMSRLVWWQTNRILVG